MEGVENLIPRMQDADEANPAPWGYARSTHVCNVGTCAARKIFSDGTRTMDEATIAAIH